MSRALGPFYHGELARRFTPEPEDPRRALGRDSSGIATAPLELEIRGVKSTPVYLAHSYPTKVPPEAIVPYIEHYTSPGEVVLDPFCGSGMTGVAARLTGRHALLNDLSVGAAHLAFNHCTPCSPEGLIETWRTIRARCEGESRWLYRTRCDSCRSAASIVYTLWSDVLACTACGEAHVVWEVALDTRTGRVRDEIRCRSCRRKNTKRSMPRCGPAVPVLTAYECLGTCGRRGEHKPTRADLDLIRETNATETPYPYPSHRLDPKSEMYIRCALHLQHIEHVSDFYTKRNLRALGGLWREINLVEDERIRAALAFAFTNTAWHATKMRRYNARGGQRPLTGTLYVPQLSAEANPLRIFDHKIEALARFYREAETARGASESRLQVRVGCATDLEELPESSIDYVFTDPPFGSNIFYADLNLIWESWLGEVTDSTTEAVINRSRKDGKSLQDYERRLKEAFGEMHRVLKPSRWASVVFHNSNGEVWQAVRSAAEEAGFELVHAGGIDKSKRSMRGYIARRNDEDIADGDVVLNLQKPIEHTRIRMRRRRDDIDGKLVDTISGHLKELGSPNGSSVAEPKLDPRSIQYVHGLALRTLLNERHAIDRLSVGFVRALCERSFLVREGRVFLRADLGPTEGAVTSR